MIRAAIACFVLFMTPAAAAAQVEIIQQNVPIHDVVVVPPQQAPIQVIPAPLPPPEPIEPVEDPPPRFAAWATYTFYLEGVNFGGEDLTFSDPDIASLADVALSEDSLPTSIVGGFMLGSGARPTPWLILPDIRFSIGGGGIDGQWHEPDNAPAGVSVRADSVFMLRAEIAGGFQYRVGPFEPFALARAALTGYWISSEVSHDELGSIGDDVVGIGTGEVGIEAGLSVFVSDRVKVTAAYRHGLVGPAGHGMTLSVGLGLGDE